VEQIASEEDARHNAADALRVANGYRVSSSDVSNEDLAFEQRERTPSLNNEE
jgi:hypothetical protein